jgi:hypothetical protein
MTLPHTGGCRCGAVRFEASSEPHHVSYCHCADCRHASGAPVSAFLGFRSDVIVFSGTEPKGYSSGPVTRTFCATCGSPVAYLDERLPDDVWIMLGAMDAPEEFKPTQHAWVREQLRYVHMPDGLPRQLGSSVPRPDGPPQ